MNYLKTSPKWSTVYYILGLVCLSPFAKIRETETTSETFIPNQWICVYKPFKNGDRSGPRGNVLNYVITTQVNCIFLRKRRETFAKKWPSFFQFDFQRTQNCQTTLSWLDNFSKKFDWFSNSFFTHVVTSLLIAYPQGRLYHIISWHFKLKAILNSIEHYQDTVVRLQYQR